ncbi:UNVERIFIED_CONTAM: hypothetical protein RMT77_005960 [Armadillidium vulgare]
MFIGCKRARTEEETINPESPSSPSKDDLRQEITLPYSDIQPLSLKIRTTTPPPTVCQDSVSSPPSDKLIAKEETCRRDEKDGENRLTESEHIQQHSLPSLIFHGNNSSGTSSSLESARPSSSSDPTALETLVRLFPGRRKQLLEAVLLRCDGDALKAIQTFLNASPHQFQTEHKSSNEENSERNGFKESVYPHSSSTPTPPNFSLNGRQTPSSTPTRSPIEHRPDIIHEHHQQLTSPFAGLPPPTLGRFSYPHPHPFMNLHYSPFLHPRPDYYSPINLAAHGVSNPLHGFTHQRSPSPIRDGSVSPSSPTDQDTE